jgi:hypothetical protein
VKKMRLPNQTAALAIPMNLRIPIMGYSRKPSRVPAVILRLTGSHLSGFFKSRIEPTASPSPATSSRGQRHPRRRGWPRTPRAPVPATVRESPATTLNPPAVKTGCRGR